MVTRAKYIAGKCILKSSTCLHNREAIIMILLQLRVQVLTTGFFIPVVMLMESRQIHFFRRLLQLRAPGVSWLIYTYTFVPLNKTCVHPKHCVYI